MRICIIGKPLKNCRHGAEVGAIAALEGLGHNVSIYDLGTQTPRESLNFEYDWVMCLGAGLPPSMIRDSHPIVAFLENNYSILWNSEPIRLQNYYHRVSSQKYLFDLHLTFDEGELPIYKALGCKSHFLPQAFHPDWYRPLEGTPKKFACFVGSVGGKWCNRQAFLQRIQNIIPTKDLTIATTFDAKEVNRIYNNHHLVLILGLYHKDLGVSGCLNSYGLQQRIFETIGAGSIPFTNLPADIAYTTKQRCMFKNGKNIIYYNNSTMEALLRFYYKNPVLLHNIQDGVIRIRYQHNYMARMVALIDKLKYFNIIQ